MGKKIIRVIAVVLIPVVCLYLLTLLLTPKYVNDIPEGSMIAEYYKSEKNNDVLILGDCEVYENISTVKMWEQKQLHFHVLRSCKYPVHPDKHTR